MKKRNDLGFYDRSAENWWKPSEKIYALYHLNPTRFTLCDRYISQWEKLNVLDVGCGGGFTCEFLANRGAFVSGIDQSEKCITKASEHAISEGLNIDYKTGVAESLPYANDTFDVVVCVDVLEHINNLNKTISEIYRVLKPHGIFFFDTINRNLKSRLIMIWLLEDILKEIPPGVHDWNKFIQPKELTHLMISTGFSDIDIKGFDLFGTSLVENILSYTRYKTTGNFQGKISEDTSLMYIGKAVKNLSTI